MKRNTNNNLAIWLYHNTEILKLQIQLAQIQLQLATVR